MLPRRSLITRLLPALPASEDWNASSMPSCPSSPTPVKPITCAMPSPPG